MGWRHPSRPAWTNVGWLGSYSLASLLSQWACPNFGWGLCDVAALDCGEQTDGGWSLFGLSEHGFDSSFELLVPSANAPQDNSFVIYNSTIKRISAKNLRRNILDILRSTPSIHFESMSPSSSQYSVESLFQIGGSHPLIHSVTRQMDDHSLTFVCQFGLMMSLETPPSSITPTWTCTCQTKIFLTNILFRNTLFGLLQHLHMPHHQSYSMGCRSICKLLIL